MTDVAIAESVALNSGKAPPALSATSDAPTEVIPGPSLSASSDVPVEPVEHVEAVEAPSLDADKATPPPAKRDETPAWMKAEITKERNKARAAQEAAAEKERAAAEALTRLDTARKALEALSQKPAGEVFSRPRRADFEDPDTYEAALVDWSSKTAAEAARTEALKEAEQKAAEEKAAQEQALRDAEHKRILDEWTVKRAKAIEEFPDYEEVAESDGLTITSDMLNVIVSADNGAALAYNLGKKPDEAARIAKLPAALQYVEMGRLIERMEGESRVQTPKLPTPPSHLVGTVAPASDSLDDLTMEAYAARRLAAIRAARQ